MSRLLDSIVFLIAAKLPALAAAALFLAAILLAPSSAAAAADPPAAEPSTTCLLDVNVVDPAEGKVVPGQRVVIEGERIVEVANEDAAREAACDVEVDGSRRFLVPGLWDMHVHGTRRRATYPLYLANGVTGVREMFGPPDVNAFRAELAAAGVDAPRLYLASPVLDGTPPIWPGSTELNTPEEARRAVGEQVVRGADFLKVYQRLGREVYFALLAEAARKGLPVDGHVPASVTLWEATAAGQRTIEHFLPFPLACSLEETSLRERPVRSYVQAIHRAAEATRSFDPPKCNLLFSALRRNCTWVVPTLTVLRSDALRDEAAFRDDPRLRFFDADARAYLAPPADQPPESLWSQEDRAAARELFAFSRELVGQMHRAGVRILAGTDALNPYIFPGFSLHEELALLVEAGLSPAAALRAATSEAAAFLGGSDDYGSVSPGKLADLVLLRADPLADIRNTREIEAVFLGGRLLDRNALDALLAAAEARAATSDDS